MGAPKAEVGSFEVEGQPEELNRACRGTLGFITKRRVLQGPQGLSWRLQMLETSKLGQFRVLGFRGHFFQIESLLTDVPFLEAFRPTFACCCCLPSFIRLCWLLIMFAFRPGMFKVILSVCRAFDLAFLSCYCGCRFESLLGQPGTSCGSTPWSSEA